MCLCNGGGFEEQKLILIDINLVTINILLVPLQFSFLFTLSHYVL